MNEETLVVADIGASGGLYKPFCDTDSIVAILFDPDERAPLPKESRQPYGTSITIPVALSDSDRQVSFHLLADQECSSCLKPNFDFLNRFPNAQRFSEVSFLSLKGTTLDAAMQALGYYPDFIKIDVQGYEYEILCGAKRSLAESGGLILEVEFEPLYIGQKLFPDIHNLMRENGFELFDLQRSFWKRQLTGQPEARGQLLFANALYLRVPENLLEWSAGSLQKQLKMIRLYSLFGYADCVEVAKKYCELDTASPPHRLTASPPQTFFRRKLHGALFRLETLISRIRRRILWRESFHCCDAKLGNL